MSASLDLSNKFAFMLVEFKYGDPAVPQHTRLHNTNKTGVFLEGNAYFSETSLQVTLPENNGGFEEEKVATVFMPVTASGLGIFLDRLSLGEPFSPLFVRIHERVQKYDETSTADYLHYRGRLVKANRNAQQNVEVVKLDFASVKSRFAVPLGIPANPQCAWTFGGRGCDIDLVPLKQSGVLTFVGGSRQVTITGLVPPAGAQNLKYFHRGFVEFEGLRIGIRDWDRDVAPTLFHLNTAPPGFWQTKIVVVTPGCDKTLTTCRDRWNNEERFAGIGYAIPPYNPLYEEPA